MSDDELKAHLDKWQAEFEERLRQMGRPVLKANANTTKSYRASCKKDDAYCQRQAK